MCGAGYCRQLEPPGDRISWRVLWNVKVVVSCFHPSRAVVVPVGKPAGGRRRLRVAGLTVSVAGDDVRLAAVAFGSAAEKVGLRAGWRVDSVSVDADRPAKEWAFIPALLLLGGVAAAQRRRRAEGTRGG